MTGKPKHAAKTTAKAKTAPLRSITTNPLRQTDNRWQRTVRYGWDKGGSKGGR